MSNFVVSARKYRPIRFDSVVGQSHITNTLKNAIRNNHLAQAFLFCGPRGVGKTTCARILAKVLNCEQATAETEPCDVCPSCKAFNENASLNIHELDAASNNSVEHIRALIEQVRFAPQRGKYKIYIIDEVHMLSQAAFNAFLKTLEEPPSYAIFILATTEKHKIIPTILSRCQIFDFNRIQIADMASHLRNICGQENIEAEEDALNIIAQKADGALRDALSIYDRIVSFSGNYISYKDVIENLNILDYDFYFKIVEAIAAEDVSQLLLIFDTIQRKGFDGDIFINGLSEHLRNLLVCQRPETIELLEVSGNTKERYLKQATLVPTALILSALSQAGDCDINYKMSRNKRLHVEMSLIKMAYIKKALQNAMFPNNGPIASDEKKNNPNLEFSHTGEENLNKLSSKSDNEKTSDEKTTENGSSKDSSQKVSLIDKLKKKENNFLNDLINKVKEEDDKPVEVVVYPDLTLENIQKIWAEYLLVLDSSSMLLLYKTAQIVAINEDEIKVILKSNRAKDAVTRDNVLLEKMRSFFGNYKLQFYIEVEESHEEPVKVKIKPTNDREKYSYFLQQNPLLADFQKQFGLYPVDFDPKKKK
jgi:DNA polymerase-3 subunit gamma/tau